MGGSRLTLEHCSDFSTRGNSDRRFGRKDLKTIFPIPIHGMVTPAYLGSVTRKRNTSHRGASPMYASRSTAKLYQHALQLLPCSSLRLLTIMETPPDRLDRRTRLHFSPLQQIPFCLFIPLAVHASNARQRQLTRAERALYDVTRLPCDRPARATVPSGCSAGEIHAKNSLEGNDRFDAMVVNPALRGGECVPFGKPKPKARACVDS